MRTQHLAYVAHRFAHTFDHYGVCRCARPRTWSISATTSSPHNGAGHGLPRESTRYVAGVNGGQRVPAGGPIASKNKNSDGTAGSCHSEHRGQTSDTWAVPTALRRASPISVVTHLKGPQHKRLTPCTARLSRCSCAFPSRSNECRPRIDALSAARKSGDPASRRESSTSHRAQALLIAAHHPEPRGCCIRPRRKEPSAPRS